MRRDARALRHTALAAVAGLALAAGGCGSGGDDGGGGGGAGDRSPATVRRQAAMTVRAADCNVWNVLAPADRTALLRAMRQVFGASVSGTGAVGTTLADPRAIRLLDGACRPEFAGRFKLYKIYGRAAAFTAVTASR